MNGVNGAMGFAPFTISWIRMKRKDREKLIATLEGHLQNDFVFIDDEQINEDQSNKQIDRKYFFVAYGYGLFMFMIMFILFYWLSGKNRA